MEACGDIQVWNDMIIQNCLAQKSLSFNLALDQSKTKFEYFSIFERPKKYMERHVTFFIFKNIATRREDLFSSVDDFQISKSTPGYKNTKI
jgi:hypothetical protein